MRTLADWFVEYGKSHQNPVNQQIHWVCVPLIYFSIVALLWVYHPMVMGAVLLLVSAYYLVMSWRLGLGMLLMNGAMAGLVLLWAQWQSEWLFYGGITLFIVAWIGQFVGHKIEGEKPSFFTDLQFLLIGPAWVMSHLYDCLRLDY